MLDKNEIQQQSIAAWKQWKSLWIKNCKINRERNKKSFAELLNYGQGRTLLQCATGYSLTPNLEKIKKYKDRFDIYCCDKSFGYLMQNDIRPQFCHIADARVSDEWIKNQDTSQTILIANIACNPKWTEKKWKEIYFYVNWDNIDSAKILAPLGNCYDVIPAASNVSNAQVVFATQVLGYDRQLLVGYDYSWEDDSWYYAGNDSDKKYWMYHLTVITPYGKLAKTSTNLAFSCRWMMQFIQKYCNNIITNCSERGLLSIPSRMSLEKAIFES